MIKKDMLGGVRPADDEELTDLLNAIGEEPSRHTMSILIREVMSLRHEAHMAKKRSAARADLYRKMLGGVGP